MKKSLLFASLFALAAGTASAVTDGCTYDAVDGLQCKSMWIRCLGGIPGAWQAEWNALPFANSNYARTACLARVDDGKGGKTDKIIVSWEELNADDNNTGTLGMMTIFNFYNGAVEKTMQLTLDGKQIHSLLCVNQVGCDDFGHVWVCGYVDPPFNAETGVAKPFIVYQVNLETGALTEAFRVELPADEKEASGRVDYYSLSGDVTRAEAPCSFMCPAQATVNKKPYVYGWKCQMGSDEFEPLMDDGQFVSLRIDDTYPADQSDWGTGAMTKIIKDDDYSASLFYVDGFTTVPTLYDNAGAMLESFASALDLAPKCGANGVGEFTLNGRNFIFYALQQYNDGDLCRARICELGEGMTFEGMKLMWDVPATGLGATSDGGNRYHATEARVYPDENGVEGAYLLTYKGRNGIGVYTVAPDNWVNPFAEEGAVKDIVADEDINAPVEYFNLNGQAIQSDNLTPGLYITRQGGKASKVIIK